MKPWRWRAGVLMLGWVMVMTACKKEERQAKVGPVAEFGGAKPQVQVQKPELKEEAPPVVTQVVSIKRAPSKALLELKLKNKHSKEVESYKCMILMLDRDGNLLEVENRWLLQGGTKGNQPLGANESRKVNVALDTTQAFASVEVIPTRVVLASGEIIDPVRGADR